MTEFLITPLRWVGWLIVLVMMWWLFASPTDTQLTNDGAVIRICLGLIMVGLSYVIEIRDHILSQWSSSAKDER